MSTRRDWHVARRSAFVATLTVVTLALAELARMFLVDGLLWWRVVTVILAAIAWAWVLRGALRADRLLRQSDTALQREGRSDGQEQRTPSP
jgi:hypothetical protein